MNYLELITDLQNMIVTGKTMEGFEKYYADNCVILEIQNNTIRKGKAAQRKAIQDWFALIEQYHSGAIKSIAANEEQATTMVETEFDITFKSIGRVILKEVGVQKWSGNQIVEERFYTNMP